jgi:O-glycosyl hydrolase
MKSSHLIIFLSLAAIGRAFGDYTVTIYPAQRYQKLEGWGTSLAFVAHVVGDFPDPLRDEFADLMFSPTKGLGLNIARYNIGGGENPALNILPTRTRMPGYEPSPSDWDWNADRGQRWMLKAGIARGVNIVEGFANSPPYWMTESGSVTGAKKNGMNNLKVSCWSDFPTYLAEVARHFYHDYGMPFRTLEPFNEPDSKWWTYGRGQEGCHFYPGSNQSSIINALAGDLAAAKVPTEVSAPDDNNIDDTVAGIAALDHEALSNLAQINTHSYHGKERGKLYKMAIRKKKRLWMSEYGDSDPTGITLAMRINEDMNYLHPVGWCYWQVIDNTPSWAMLWNPGNGTDYGYTIEKKYWVYGNFTKFIQPGSIIVGTNDPTYTTAAIAPSNSVLTVVTTNQGNTVQTVTYDLSYFDINRIKVTAYQTSANGNLTTVPVRAITGDKITMSVPGASVTTVVFSGVMAKAKS